MTETKFTQSLVGIISDKLKPDANLLAQVMGFGLDTYSVALSPTGAAPATHWAFHAAATAETVAVLSGAAPMPPIPWEKYGLTLERVKAVQDAVVLSSQGRKVSSAFEHFTTAIKSEGLQNVVGELPE